LIKYSNVTKDLASKLIKEVNGFLSTKSSY